MLCALEKLVMQNVENDVLEKVSEIPAPQSAAACPTIVMNEEALIIRYISDDFSFIAHFPTGNINADENFEVSLRFDRSHWHCFGYPNDEALPGHPLYGQGLGYYGIYHVRNSSAIAALASQNEISFPGSKHLFDNDRHLIITFQDNTFECVFTGEIILAISLDVTAEKTLSFV
jgi:hypothetical protein